MKKRKGKQAKAEGASSQEPGGPTPETEATTAQSQEAEGVADDVARADAAEASGSLDTDATSSAAVAEVGDDEVTNRLDVNAIDGEVPPDDDFADEPTLADGRHGEAATPGSDGSLADTTLTDVVGEAAGEGGEAPGGENSSEPPSDTAAEAGAAESGEGLPLEGPRLESILESILFASDRPLAITDLKRLLGERDGKRLTVALESLRDKRVDCGIQLVSVAGGWQLRTHPTNGAWVAKLVAGRPPRLSRAMMETLSIVAYRQPITRPEVDEIRGVDCGPVLHTLLDRGLIRVIGKKEEVGRPMLYGTTPEFLKTFSLKDLSDLPTLREFHELGAEDRARVDATAEGSGASVVAVTDAAGAPVPGQAVPLSVTLGRSPTAELSDPDPDEEDALLDALDQASSAAARATASPSEPNPEPQPGAEGVAANAAAPPPSPETAE